MDRLFLDANVLFSAAYREEAGVVRLWAVRAAELLTSEYAVVEARRNLVGEERLVRLGNLLRSVEVTSAGMPPADLRRGIRLPEKDWPIVGGALAAGATHLVTGDQRHFGLWFGRDLLGIRVVTPADYLRGRSAV